MKSIKDTLETIRGIINALPVRVDMAVAGGYAVILHGVERTTLDVDFCLYADLIRTAGAEEEKAITFALAERTGRDKKLVRLLAPPEEEVREIPEELL